MFDQDFLFSEFYLSLLFKFKIRPLLVICPPNAVMLIIIFIIRIMKTTCFDNTILKAELEGKLP